MMTCKDCGKVISFPIKAELVCFDCYSKKAQVQTRPHRIPCLVCGKLKAQGTRCINCTREP